MRTHTHKKTLGALALASVLPMAAQAATVTWDGDAADGLWDTATNWDGDTVPGAGDDVIISNGDTVTGTTFNGNYTVTLSGNSTLADGGVWRAGTTTVTVESGSTLGSGGFWDLNNATLNFKDGAAVNMGFWEHKNTNVFNFELGAAGFTTLTPGNLTEGAPPAITTTYSVDMANYTGGTGVIDLVDFGGDSTGLTNAIFTGGGQYVLAVNNAGSYTAALQWDDATDKVQLNITAVPEPSSAALLGLGGLALILRRRK